jgi:hypothetical protein
MVSYCPDQRNNFFIVKKHTERWRSHPGRKKKIKQQKNKKLHFGPARTQGIESIPQVL